MNVCELTVFTVVISMYTYNYYVLQVSRDVTSSVLDAIDVASVSLARHLDAGQASLTVETSSFTVTASRWQAVDVGGSFVGRPGEGVALPRDLPLVNSTADVILTVRNSRQTLRISKFPKFIVHPIRARVVINKNVTNIVFCHELVVSSVQYSGGVIVDRHVRHVRHVMLLYTYIVFQFEIKEFLPYTHCFVCTACSLGAHVCTGYGVRRKPVCGR